MNIFKETFTIFKKSFLKLFFIETLFLFSAVLFFNFFRNKVSEYLITAQGYSNLLESSNLSNIIDVNNNLDSLNVIVQKTYIYSFIIFPIVIFLLYVIFQGMSYYLIKKNFSVKKKFNIYLLRFLLSSLLFVFILLLFIRDIIFNEFSILLLVILLLLGYFTILSYYYLDSNLKKIFNLGLKKIYVLLPLTTLLFLFYFSCLLLIFLLLFNFNLLFLLGIILVLFLIIFNKNFIFTYLHHK